MEQALKWYETVPQYPLEQQSAAQYIQDEENARNLRTEVLKLDETGFKARLTQSIKDLNFPDLDVLRAHPTYGSCEELRLAFLCLDFYFAAERNNMENVRSLMEEWTSDPSPGLDLDARKYLFAHLGSGYVFGMRYANREMIQFLLGHRVSTAFYGIKMLAEIRDDRTVFEPILQDLLDAGQLFKDY